MSGSFLSNAHHHTVQVPAATYSGGVSPSAVGTKYSTCTPGGFTHCNLRQWCFSFHPLAQIPDMHLSKMHWVVVFSGGGGGGCSYGDMIATCTAGWWYFEVCTGKSGR